MHEFIDFVYFICIYLAGTYNDGPKSNRLVTSYDKENLAEPLRKISDQIEEEGRSLGIIKNLKYGVGIVNPTYKVHRSIMVKDANGNLKRRIWKCPIYTRWVDMISRCYGSDNNKVKFSESKSCFALKYTQSCLNEITLSTF